MGKRRTYWAKMNMDEARESIEIMDDAEAGRWFRAWMAGASGKEIAPEKVASWTLEQRAGFAAGILAFKDAQAFSEAQRERVASRYTEKLPKVTAVASGSNPVVEKATGSLPTNNEQRTTNRDQPEPITEQPEATAPPTLEEWVEHCRAKWPDWPTSRIEAAWYHYEKAGWGSRWRGSAATAHAKAVEWGHIPKPTASLPHRHLQGC